MAEPATAKLIVTREKAYIDRIRDYRILLDGAEVLRVGAGGVVEAPIVPGPHSLEARIDWARSQPLTFDAKAGEEVVVQVENPWNALTALFAAVVRPTHYLVVSRGT